MRDAAVNLQERLFVLILRLCLSAASSEKQFLLRFVTLVQMSEQTLGAVVGGQRTLIGVSVT